MIRILSMHFPYRIVFDIQFIDRHLVIYEKFQQLVSIVSTVWRSIVINNKSSILRRENMTKKYSSKVMFRHNLKLTSYSTNYIQNKYKENVLLEQQKTYKY